MTNDRTTAALLQAAGMAEAVDKPIDVDRLASELSTSVETIRVELDHLHGMGLVSFIAEDEPPRLLHAGRQWLARNGDWSPDVLRFPPIYIDDLHARRALMDGVSVLVDEFRYQLGEAGLKIGPAIVNPQGRPSAARDAVAQSHLRNAQRARGRTVQSSRPGRPRD